jgi:hypothetical protein
MEGRAGAGSLTATTDNAWTWSSNVPWLTSDSPLVRLGDGEFTYAVAENTTTSSRSGKITFQAGTLSRTLTVNQGPQPIPLVFTSFQRTGNNIALTFRSETGKSYRVMTSSSMETGSWTLVPGHSGISGTGNPISRTLTGMAVPPAEGKRFFRVEKE